MRLSTLVMPALESYHWFSNYAEKSLNIGFAFGRTIPLHMDTTINVSVFPTYNIMSVIAMH